MGDVHNSYAGMHKSDDYLVEDYTINFDNDVANVEIIPTGEEMRSNLATEVAFVLRPLSWQLQQQQLQLLVLCTMIHAQPRSNKQVRTEVCPP